MNKEELLTQLSNKLSKKIQLDLPTIIATLEGLAVEKKELLVSAINAEDVISLSNLVIQIVSEARSSAARIRLEQNMVGETIAIADLLEAE